MPAAKKKGARKSATKVTTPKKLQNWRRLDDKAIASVLEVADLSVDAQRREELKRSINEALTSIGRLRSWRAKHTPSQVISNLRKASDAARRLKNVLDHGGITVDLVFEFDRLLGTPEARPRASQLEFQRLASCGMSAEELAPSRWALRCVGEARGNVALLEKLAEDARTLATTIQGDMGTRERPQRPDYFRYALASELAEIFERVVGQSAKADESQPFCQFLAAVLSHSEGRKIKARGAQALWLEARSFFRERFLCRK
jgi:hypothetical protein